MIELVNVTKIYNFQTPKEHVALKDVNFKIEKGEFVVLLGPSGSGKSTLLSLIAAMTKPTFGKVVVDGEVISKYPPRFASLFRREKIGMIFQKFNLIEDITVFDNITLPLIPTSMSAKEITQRAYDVMQQFSIEHKSDMVVSKLSGGEQQRVAIARAFVNDPSILIADEPTASLDVQLSKELLDTFARFKKKKTIIIATHDPLVLELGCIDTIYEVKEGHVSLA